MEKITLFFEKAKENYAVEDITTEDTKMLFILESPHKEELKAGVPLAGLSGRSMAKELFMEQSIDPFGKHLKQLIEKNKPTIYGILNVCSFPLQSSAYPDQDFVKEFQKELKIAEALRISSAKRFSEQEKAMLHSMITDNFQSRLLAAIKEDTIIVPCGKFAEKYVTALSDQISLTIIGGVPHPSYNSWARERYKELIHKIREEGKKRTS
ncbi:hypothetical protein KUV80_04680 [Fictibacillus nanhaiensis]|uniref:uracil-DNA glycosylase family protein n=1 Tax=Fictibacillus nanhaiensis TaxID=742169 RepID=UPI001C945348|nr:uracil-DNA glycosylase family protein [Fictibacillus nanhaiensis]MBY6035931.1 hypothetical protein [Fictibacillus nanhaiensis]